MLVLLRLRLRFIINVICATPEEFLALSLAVWEMQIATVWTSGHDGLNVGAVVSHMRYRVVLL